MVCAGEIPADYPACLRRQQVGAARPAPVGRRPATDRRGGTGWFWQEHLAVELDGGQTAGHYVVAACDEADANAVRFWAAFIEAPRAIAPWFGADAAELLGIDRAMSADVIASLANDAAKLPPGSAVIVDDFHAVSATVAEDFSDLVERWPAETTQLILASRRDPPVRLHRLRLAGELCEVGEDELRFSQAECRDLLVSFGLELRDEPLALLHQRTEGWAAALQMAAQTLRGSGGSAQVARALAALSHAISEYFVSEVLDRQSPDVAQFMLDISILGQLTPDSCAALTGRSDAARLLRSLGGAHVFLVALDDARTGPRRGSFRPAGWC